MKKRLDSENRMAHVVAPMKTISDNRQLMIPHTELGETFCKLPTNLNDKEWLRIGKTFGKIESCKMWWIGDWLKWKYPDRVPYKDWDRTVEKTGITKGILQQAYFVAQKSLIRIKDLSWSFHQIIAICPENKREELLNWTVKNKATIRQLRAEIKRRKRLTETIGDWEGPVQMGDAVSLMRAMPEKSIDLIFTDPPYDAESLPLYQGLLEQASRLLKEYGNLIFYAPTWALAEILNYKSNLKYWWTICMKHAGGPTPQEGKGVKVAWKPLVWFVREGRLPDKEWIIDLIDSEKPAKDLHPWEQSTVEALYCIRWLTRKNDIVLDPFAGLGTTLISALQLDRQAIGIEKDPKYVALANKRIAECQRANKK